LSVCSPEKPEIGVKEAEKRRVKIMGQLVYEKLPLFGLAILSVILTLVSQRQEIITMQYLPMPLRISNAIVSYCGYLAKTVWPFPLAVLYPHPEFIPTWQMLGATVLLITVTVLAVRMARRYPYFLVGWLWYLGMLVPVIGLVQVGVQSMADRYTYIPLTGIFIAAVWLISEIAGRLKYKKYILLAVSIVFLGFLFAVAQKQISHWRNSQSLFSHALFVTKNNYVMHTNMGALMAGQGNIQEALSHYNKALQIRPDDLEGNYNLGNLYLRQGRFRDAIFYYGEAVRSKPDFAPAHNNLGIALGQSGDRTKAVEQFRKAVSLDPGYEEAQNNLKIAQAIQDKSKETVLAKDSTTTAITDQESADGQVEAGLSAVKKGDLAGGIDHFRKALKLDPNHYEAHVHMGLSLAFRQNLDEAIIHFRKAIQINPKPPEAYNSLGVALAKAGKMEEAVTQLKEAIRINPKFAKAHNSLGVILAKNGKIDEALAYLQEAVRLQPDYQEAKKNLDIVQNIKAANR
jgi:tetratricopeptide (TPR) repeat protein